MNVSRAEIAARIARYHRGKDLSVLWPDLSQQDFDSAHRAITRATATIISSDTPPPPVALPPYGQPRALGAAAFISGMGPLLGYWIEQGRLTADGPAAELLGQHLAHGRRRTTRLLEQLRRILAAFHEREITVVLLKGVDTSHRYFPEPGTRPMADLDLLVTPDRFGPARQALNALGFVEQEGMTRPHRTEWLLAGATREVHSLDLNHAENPWALDLHTTLDRDLYPGLGAAFGPFDIEAQSPWQGSSRTRALGQPLLLAYLACNTSQDFPTLQLVRLVELALVARRDFAGRAERWDAFASFVAETRTERFVYPSLELADRLAPGTLDPLVRRRLVPAVPPRVRRVVERTDVGSLVRFRPLWLSARLMWATRPREYLAYLVYLVWPRTPGGPVGLGQFFRQQRRRLSRLLATGWQRLARG
ncbi:MAG TPA: nucleotidyltransferase family protein [Gemmatimonadales bacterium]